MKAGRQVKDRAVKAGNVRLLSHAAKEKKPSPLKVAVTLATTKAASLILIAKTRTVKPLLPEGRSVQEAIVRTVEAGIAAVEADGIAEVAVVALEVEAIVVLAAAVVEIAETANLVL